MTLHAVLCAAGYNISWLLWRIAKKGNPYRIVLTEAAYAVLISVQK